MKSVKRKNRPPSRLQIRLSGIEKQLKQLGVQVHYDIMQAAGLKLKGGMCKINGERHLFIDKKKPLTDRLLILQDYLEHPLPEDIPTNE
jgi:hypothetical protein